MRDYDLGDWVTIQDRDLGIEIDAQIVEVTTTLQNNETINDIIFEYGKANKIEITDIKKLSASVEEVSNNIKYMNGYIKKQSGLECIKQVQNISATQSSQLAVNTFSEDIIINLDSYGFKTVPIVITQAQGWLEPRVKSVSTSSIVVQFYNAGTAAHSGGAKFILIELS